MKYLNETILFKSERINYTLNIIRHVIVIFIIVVLFIMMNLYFISNHRISPVRKESISDKHDFMMKDFDPNDSIALNRIRQIHNTRNEKENINDQPWALLIFLDLFTLFIVFALVRKIFNYYYKYAVIFMITDKSIIINRFRRKEIISFDSVDSITMIGKVNFVGYLSNYDKNAIVIKTQNSENDSYIIVNKYIYSNLSDLIILLKNKIPQKIIINRVEGDIISDFNSALLGLGIGIYVVIKEGFNVQGLLLGLIIIIAAIVRFGRKKKNPCPELFD